jgi:ABC-type multidrug transport system permease subunit
MEAIAAFIRRDWRIARTHTMPFALDGLTVVVNAALFFYLGRYVGAGGDGFFTFAVAGLAVLRVNAAIPLVLQRVGTELASGNWEGLVSSKRRAGTILIGEVAFETLRGMAVAIAWVIVAGGLFGAPLHFGVAAVAAVVLGVAGAGLLFAGLGVAIIGILMVVRQGATLGSLTGIAVPVLAGAYFPLATLPEPLRTFADALPFHLPVDLMRGALLHDHFSIGTAAALVAGSLTAMCLALLIGRACIEHARRRGTLTAE